MKINKWVLIIIGCAMLWHGVGALKASRDKDEVISRLKAETTSFKQEIKAKKQLLEIQDSIIEIEKSNYEGLKDRKQMIVVKWKDRVKEVYDTITRECHKDITYMDNIIRVADSLMIELYKAKKMRDTIIQVQEKVIVKYDTIIDFQNKVIKRQRKKIAVTIGGGYGITNNGLSPNVGLNIGWKLIEF